MPGWKIYVGAHCQQGDFTIQDHSIVEDFGRGVFQSLGGQPIFYSFSI